MNERTQKQAELAALAQRLQLDALHRALQTLEDHLDALESESARQSAELSQLDEKIARLHAEAGLARPPGLARPGTQELADADVPDHPQPSPQETRAVRQRSTDLSCSFAPPDVGEDWDAYLRNVERYIADHGIEVTRDPLAQLLPPHRAAEVRSATSSPEAAPSSTSRVRGGSSTTPITKAPATPSKRSSRWSFTDSRTSSRRRASRHPSWRRSSSSARSPDSP